MSTEPKQRIADALRRDIIAAIKAGIGLHDHLASAAADQVMNRLQAAWGGREIYIPVPAPESRNEEIRKAFNGRNHTEVCQKFNISMRTLYRVVGK